MQGNILKLIPQALTISSLSMEHKASHIQIQDA